ncbi:hypothetical protein H072_7817 [Dactylellina haptotyla CBS 200.50]|uniref:Uncharacterized protein n=1 Tax=Dactylellina haptotyla (strain CBS 200.50) TaxID=1284197 RepID=S8BT91_DACHA|nr:hypothetical protein H072_7817 [Dactylellina haptotyla CBS 200.50]
MSYQNIYAMQGGRAGTSSTPALAVSQAGYVYPASAASTPVLTTAPGLQPSLAAQYLPISAWSSVMGTPITTPGTSTVSSPYNSIRSSLPGYSTAVASNSNLIMPPPPVYDSTYRPTLEHKRMAAHSDLRFQEILRTRFIEQQRLEREDNLAIRRVWPDYQFWDPYSIDPEPEECCGCTCQ